MMIDRVRVASARALHVSSRKKATRVRASVINMHYYIIARVSLLTISFASNNITQAYGLRFNKIFAVIITHTLKDR